MPARHNDTSRDQLDLLQTQPSAAPRAAASKGRARATAAIEHHCHAHECGKKIQPKLLFCLAHWRMLRKPMQQAIWREYRPGQENDKQPSLRYLAVQQRAVGEVAYKSNAAAADVAHYCMNANRYRHMAIQAGDGDPLEGLCELRPLPTTQAAPEAS